MNNLKKRIERHLSDEKKIFWHIDYLLESDHAKITHVYWKGSSEKEECTIARKMTQWGEPIKKFGCSDCTCESHLFRIDESISLQSISKGMGLSMEEIKILYKTNFFFREKNLNIHLFSILWRLIEG